MRNLIRRLILWACPELVTRPDLAVLYNTINNNAGQTMSQNKWIMALWRDYVARCPEDAKRWETGGAGESGGNPAAYATADRPLRAVPDRDGSFWTHGAPAAHPGAASSRPAPAIPGLEPEVDPRFGTQL